MALWLAKKNELVAHENATYNLVMAGWFEPTEVDVMRDRTPSAKFLAGLTHTWILDDPAWLELLIAIANHGDPTGPMQIEDDMYLVVDDDGDGIADRRCTLPGWDGIHAMDPRHPGWRQLILSFYEVVGQQPQHDGVIIDMVDAYPFCEGAWSDGVPTPLDTSTWVSAQNELLAHIREVVPPDKWVLANAGRDFSPESPFPQHLNGYLLENFLGSWGADLEEGLTSAQRAVETTQPPHLVVFAVDTDDTGEIDWSRFRVGFAASLLFDHTYFAFDFGSRDHGGVTDWWFPEYYKINLGDPLGAYYASDGGYYREFENGIVVIAAEGDVVVRVEGVHVDALTGITGTDFALQEGDAGVFLRSD